MSCKSALYAVNNQSQIIENNSNINFGTIVRRFGSNCNLSGGNVIINGTGYYDIDTNFIFTPTTDGIISIGIYKDGTLIPGAFINLTVVIGNTYSITIPAIIRETCLCESTLSVRINNVDAVFSNASISVEKI